MWSCGRLCDRLCDRVSPRPHGGTAVEHGHVAQMAFNRPDGITAPLARQVAEGARMNERSEEQQRCHEEDQAWTRRQWEAEKKIRQDLVEAQR